MSDLDLAAYEPESMTLALWASTLSRSLLVVWAGLFLIGTATCWGRLLGSSRAGEVGPTAWLWTLPLGYLSFRSTLKLLTPCHTLPYCLSLLEHARVQWWRLHEPWRYLVQTAVTLARHFFFIGAILVLAAVLSTHFGALYSLLPFDANRAGNLLIAGAVSMVLGIISGFLYRPLVERRRDRYLGRSAELIRWLLEKERLAADGGPTASGQTSSSPPARLRTT